MKLNADTATQFTGATHTGWLSSLGVPVSPEESLSGPGDAGRTSGRYWRAEYPAIADVTKSRRAHQGSAAGISAGSPRDQQRSYESMDFFSHGPGNGSPTEVDGRIIDQADSRMYGGFESNRFG